jgi:hypothetical protein
VSGLLAKIHRNPGWSWAILLVYAALVTFPHENVQWVTNEIAIRISHKRLYQASAAIGLAEVALLTCILWRRIRGLAAVFWILTIALIWGAWRLFTANNVELVHYPQYVPEGMILFALTLSAAEALSWVVILGGLDECFQYAVLNKARMVQYDFNDIFMDLLGGAAGVLLAMAFFSPDSRPAHRRTGVLVLLGIIAIGIGLWAAGVMVLYKDPADSHSWFALSREKPEKFLAIVPMNGPRKYHELSPIEGPLLILTTIALYSILDGRRKRLPHK